MHQTNQRNCHMVSFIDLIHLFAGNQCWSSLKKIIEDSLPGADFIESRSCCALYMNSFWYTLHCNRYKCLEIWQQRQNLGQWRIRPFPPIPKTTARNGHIPSKDLLSQEEVNHFPTNEIVKSQYFYGQTVISTLMPDIPTSTIKVILMFHLVPKNCDLLKFQTSKLVFSSNNQSWVYRNPKFQVYWAQWTKAMNHFPFKLSRTIWMHVRYWKEKTRFGSSDAFYRGSTLT